MPAVDHSANQRKRKIDALAGKLLDLDAEKLITLAGNIAFQLLGPERVRLMVTGGAGSGKTTVSSVIAERLNLPCFDFDEYVVNGWHPDGKEYRRRLVAAMSRLYDDLPYKTGWVVEHVEACNGDMLKAFQPTHCLLLAPPAQHLLDIAGARARAGGEKSPASLEQRALESSEYARMQFEKAPGSVMARGNGWVLKKMG